MPLLRLPYPQTQRGEEGAGHYHTLLQAEEGKRDLQKRPAVGAGYPIVELETLGVRQWGLGLKDQLRLEEGRLEECGLIVKFRRCLVLA